MSFKTSVIILSYLAFSSCTSVRMNSSLKDINLIVPKKSAEGYTLGEEITADISIIDLNEIEDIGDIMGTDCFSEIKFDSFIYKKESSVIFLQNGIITAIAGLKIERRITSDAVMLTKGIDNFILSYGNSGLAVYKKNNHTVYFYKNLGIALFNDHNDDVIDMYIIFN